MKWTLFFQFDRYELKVSDVTIEGVNNLDDLMIFLNTHRDWLNIEGHIINTSNINYIYPQEQNESSN